MSTPSTESKAIEFAWIGVALGEQFAAQVTGRLQTADDKLADRVQERKGQDDVAVLRSALVTLRTLPISFAVDLQNAVSQKFQEKLRRLESGKQARAGFSMNDLTLVDDDQMREEIVAGKAVQRLREDIGAEFFGLTRRLCFLTDRDGIPDSENPGFPSTLIQALLDTLRSCAESRDILIAMFEALLPEIEAGIVPVYYEVNAEMVRRGVLIEVSETVIKHGHTSGLGVGMGAGHDAPTMQSTAGRVGGATPPQQSLSAHGASDDFFAPHPQSQTSGFMVVQSPPVAPLFPQPRAAEQAAAWSQTSAPANVSPRSAVDRSTLTAGGLIALAFEQLKQDPRVAMAGTEVWNLLLPSVLRAAETDNSIFSTDDQCVRLCVDRFAEFIATQGLHAGAFDEAEAAMLDVARWLAESSKTSKRAFEMAAERLDGLIDGLESAAAAAREETHIIAEFEVMEEARNAARDAINLSFSSQNVPERIRQFAEEAGFEVLISDYLNGGRSGALWISDIETFNMLVSSLQPIRSQEQRLMLTTRLPMIVSRLSAGLTRTGRSAADLREFLDDLKPIYEALSQPEPDGAVLDVAPTPDPVESTIDAERTAALAPVPNLRMVRWVAFTEADGKNEVRCRMNWQSPAKTTYLFRNYVDREYIALSFNDLAQRYRGGLARNVVGLEIATPYFRTD